MKLNDINALTVFNKVFGEYCENVIIKCEECTITDSYILFYNDNVYYIYNFQNNILISFYKRLCKSFYCSVTYFDTLLLLNFLVDLKYELGKRLYE